ncbi:MAG TPA: sulfatase [bacterium]|nr:sulfatase [bacterium]
MDRRKFIGATAGAVGGIMLESGRALAQANQKPNIVIIMADDLGYGDLSSYGSEAVRTPNLDRLATEGVKLTEFFASAPVCSPSRAGLLTGRYPVRTGTTQVYFPSRNPLTPAIHSVVRLGPGMNPREITMAQALKPAGYATCCIGKWHLGDMKRYRPNHRGFDHYLGLLYSNDMTPLPLYRNDEIIEKSPVDQNFLTRKYTKEAVEWIGENHDQPFLLYFPHTFPHQPLHASPEFRGRSDAGLYGDCVEEVDWSVGEVLKALDRYGIADNTLVFFTSDNGPWYQGSPGGYRGRKGETFDGGMKVPGIARFPGVIPAGSTSDEMSMNFDLFATALTLAGAPLPDDRPIDGRDIMPMLAGGPSPHEALYYYKGRKLQSMRMGKFKYRRRTVGYTTAYAPLPQGPMLFNLEDDPGESYNVMDKFPDVAKKMEAMMRDWEATMAKGVPRR